MTTGIDSISFYAPRYFLDLQTLAREREIDGNKYYAGLGQERMAVCPPDEDIVTMAAAAAQPLMEEHGSDDIDTVLFATETGIDQSKAAGIYVHRLLDLPRRCRVVELKQACYSGTAALQLACALAAQRPQQRVLVLAADVARYGLGTRGEPTQGCGAIAMTVSTDPRVLAIDSERGLYTDDVMDFWRPNYSDTAFVDGHYSTRVYLESLLAAWNTYQQESGRGLEDFSRFCYHQPFTKMALKAHLALTGAIGANGEELDALHAQILDSLHYNRVTGNSYTASLYEGLVSLLDRSQEKLSGQRIGLFSYGSGCVAEFFSGVVQADKDQAVRAQRHRALLENRIELSHAEYADFYSFAIPKDGGTHSFPQNETGPFRFAGISEHKRNYEKVV